ncbi:sensor histidine kinase [Cohnella cellulosilytica]|uniref:Sensor histidine kinase n=1 Tax=Cohnella cellulosilytica TaxID=986710 RepID=A0ABW2FJA7_9BACL
MTTIARALAKLIEWPARRMERKLFIVFLFLVLLPVGLIGYMSAERYADSIEANTVTYVSELSDAMISKLDDYILDMKKISIIPSYLDDIRIGLKRSNVFYALRAETEGNDGQEAAASPSADGILPEEELLRLEIQREAESSIYFMNNIKQGTNSVYLFDRYGHAYFALKSGGVRGDLERMYPQWKELAQEGHGYPILVSTQEVSGRPSNARYVFTVVREIVDTSFESIGTIAVDANIAVIENIVRDLDKTTFGTTLIVDERGRVIFDSEKKYLTRSFPHGELLERASGLEGSFHAVVDGRPMLTIYKRSEETGWKMIITVPERELMAGAVKTRNLTLATTLAAVLLALLISLVLIIALTRPLRTLVRLMKVVQSGNLDVTFPVRRPDETGLVGSAFNRMLLRVRTLIDDVYLAGQRNKEAELKALQNQINPHFIYNTLESIRMTAVMNDDTEVSDMTHLLGKLLRYGIGGGTETVPLSKELEHLKLYVQLLNYRYGNRFSLSLPTGPFDGELPVMKLLFQPIVENSVNHGLEDGKPTMDIRIRCERNGLEHRFVISDNGAGMSEEALRQLKLKLEEPERSRPSSGSEEEDPRGIGLRNVHERLRLRYGEMFGLQVEAEEGAGTTVTVRFPAEAKSGRERTS